MSCDEPIKCKYWDGKKCVYEGKKDMCAIHQERIDCMAIRELQEALSCNNFRDARVIANSPFVSFSRR